MADAAPKSRHKLHVEVPPGEHTVFMRREFDYPRELVWRVYTDGQQMKHWWWPS